MADVGKIAQLVRAWRSAGQGMPTTLWTSTRDIGRAVEQCEGSGDDARR